MKDNQSKQDVINLPQFELPDLNADQLTVDHTSRTEVLSVDEEDYDKREKEQRLHENQEAHDLRIKHLGRLYWLSVGWILGLFIIIALQGFACKGFHLSDTVMVAFMTTTTTTVLGLYGIGAFWLYKKVKNLEKEHQ